MVGSSRRGRIFRWSAGVLALLLFVAYVAGSVVVTAQLYHPVRWQIKSSPAQYGIPYETVHFTSAVDNVPLVGWYMGPRQPGGKTIMVLHGLSSARDNGGNMEVEKALAEHGYSIFTFDFRGHGDSGGSITSIGPLETRDVTGALAYLRTRGVTQVGVVGHSMGAATALLAAPDHPEMRAIVADSSFADLWTILEREGEQATFIAPLFRPGIELAGKLLYDVDPLQDDPARAVARLKNRPLLLIQGAGDPLIPVSEAYRLQKAGAGDPNVQLWVAQATGHDTVYNFNKGEYVSRLLSFFDRQLKVSATGRPSPVE